MVRSKDFKQAVESIETRYNPAWEPPAPYQLLQAAIAARFF